MNKKPRKKSHFVEYLGWICLAFCIAVAMLAFVTGAAYAASNQLVVSWDAPTKRQNDVDLMPYEIQKYRIIVKTPIEDNFVWAGRTLGHENEFYYDIQLGMYGEYCFAVATVDIADLSSGYSDPKCVDVQNDGGGLISVKPKKVTNLQINRAQ